MFKKMTFAFVTLTILTVVPAFARNSGCKNGKFVGSYTAPNLAVDLFGDGSVVHSFAVQLNLHSDGTADQYFTGFPDYLINIGSGTPGIGSWICRSDGKLVVTLLSAGYGPSPLSANAPNPDTTLVNHLRITNLFSVEDEVTLKRVQRRSRRYNVSQDPTDPAGGTLLPLNTTEVVFKRVVASDADLLAP